MDEVQVTIIGAGIVGLAIAAELSKVVSNVVVVEKNEMFGMEISSRNSEVIHSGIYYAPGSLKAQLCVEGAGLMYALCEEYGLPVKKTGKLIVAAHSGEIPVLEALYNNGVSNGVTGLAMLKGRDTARFGVACKAVAALYVPDTGIVSSHAVMKHFAGAAQAKGATIAYNAGVTYIVPTCGNYKVTIAQDNYSFLSRIVINCAGLSSDKVAAMTGLEIASHNYRIHYCKGSYFYYAQPYVMPILVYPVPEKQLTGLGVHATIDLAGRLRFGPDTEYVDTLDYNVDKEKRDTFYDSAAQVLKGLNREAFQPDMAGIRPKLYDEGEAVRDFVIIDETANGLPGLINCIGIESPGLTSSPAIGKKVCSMVRQYIG